MTSWVGARRAMPDAIRILVVDDHAAFAESLREVLGRRDGFELTATAGNGDEALRIAEEAKPDVILMDQRLPDATGAQTTARILSRLPSTKVVMLTGGGTDDEMLEAVEAGVSGYLIKTARVAEIADAIQRVAAGEMLIPAATLSTLMRRARERAKARADRARQAGSLSHRERDVLRLMADAAETAVIASTLGISANTARGYVQTVLEKLDAHSRLEAVLRAQELGVLGDQGD
jgi:DNA-binding NarL/FixJ family response regulator